MLLVLGLAPVLTAGSYTFTSLAVPSGTNTSASGINDLGTIVGLGPAARSFVWEKGTHTALNVPGSVFTTASGIVGFYGESSRDHRFIFSNGVFTRLDASFPDVTVTETAPRGHQRSWRNRRILSYYRPKYIWLLGEGLRTDYTNDA